MSDGPTLVSNQGDQSSSSISGNTSARSSRHRNRAPRRPRQEPGILDGSQAQAPQGRHPDAAQSSRRQRNGPGNGPRPDGARTLHPSRDGPVNNSSNAVTEDRARLTTGESNRPRASRQQRSRRFGSQLTSSGADGGAGASRNPDRRQIREQQPAIDPGGLDLTSRLIYSFTHKEDALDCPICFNSVHPAQPIWSCSPSPEADACCWGTFHLKCIRSWAAKSVKETREAYAARNEERDGEWRCPSCRTMRHEVPTVYTCFCGRTRDPKGGRLITPHSCGESCIRSRSCKHSCPLPCHPGPCPPCLLSVEQPCHCGKEVIVSRCSRLQEDPNPSLSCGRVCGKPLSCGKHSCTELCHPYECSECLEIETIRCYCGKGNKSVACGSGESIACSLAVDGEINEWEGRYECDSLCDQPYACGIHRCESNCHPPSRFPGICPRDPSVVTTCPCGKRPVQSLPNGVRASCAVPVPTCGSTCGKLHESCSHACLSECHIGSCPPCAVQINVTCRCGQTARYVPCSVQQTQIQEADTVENGGAILCDIRCGGMKHCGRHACSRICCPLAGISQMAKKAGKAKRRGAVDSLALEEEDVEGWHTCDLACNKRLPCGNHLCAEPDHRGPCPPCLQSSFEELICHCGQTIVEPPVPCGTQIQCPYPCARAGPPCGHPKSPHSCHENAECPPCPFLTSKPCACGKSNMANVRCSQEKVSCGKPCGKFMVCGYHQCDKACHSGDCGTCTQVCSKPRKSCLPLQHGCTSRCHAPSACLEDEPCKAVVTLRCECGRLQQPATCGASASNLVSKGHGTFQLRCNQDCAVAKRNRNLAEALGIDAAKTSKFVVTWPEDLITTFRTNPSFGLLVEKTFNEFVSSDKRLQVLPHMPPQRREFVHKVADVYRITARDIDQEPRRSVELAKRLDTRLPEPMLSKAAGPPPTSAPISSRRLAVITDGKKASAWGTVVRTPTMTASSGTATTPAATAPTPPPAANTATPSSERKYPNSALGAHRLAIAAQGATSSTVPAPTGNPEAEAPANWEDDV